MKKLFSLVLALSLILALAAPVFAQDVTVGNGNGAITISNAAKGETYKIYKLFDATVNADGTSIAYTGTIPEALSSYFSKDAVGNIIATDAAKDGDGMSEGLRAALTDWVKTATATSEAKSDGSALSFKGLDYGYYVVTTSQGEQLISVDSTMPNATIVDKNSTTPKELVKSVDDTDVFIGQTVTYTASFKTSNYDGAGTDAKKIVSYTIEDTLPEFLSDVTVTSIIVDNDGNAETTDDQTTVTAQFDTDKKITINWYDEDQEQFLYDNGAIVIITYTAKVTEDAAIDGNGNTNKVTVTWTTEGNTEPGPDKLEDDETIFTYAIALKKVNDKGEALEGAVFQLPFYVNETPDTDGAYVYAGTEQKDGLTNQLTTPESGVIIIKGVESGTYVITEVTAPDGYNKLNDPVSVTATKTGQTTTNTTVYLDENGNVTSTETEIVVNYQNNDLSAAVVVVVNKTGVELPSTGGIGTTIFYVVGGILVAAAAILLVTKKRTSAEG